MTADGEGSLSSRERYRRIGLGLGFGAVERIVTAAMSAIRIPLLLAGLGVRDYGLWVAVMGVVQSGLLMRLGLHYGVTNLVAEARGRGDVEEVRSVVSTGFLVYVGIAALGCLVLLAAVSVVPVGWLFGVGGIDERTAAAVLLVGYSGLMLVMPLETWSAALGGFQEGWVISGWRAALALLQVAVLAVALFGLDCGLKGLAIASVGFDLLAAVAIASWICWKWRPELRVSLGAARRRLVRPLFVLGIFFFVVDLANTLKWSIGSPVVSHFLGPQAVPLFSVGFQLFMIAQVLTSFVANLFWPAFAESAASGDWGWVDAAFRRGQAVSALSAGILAVLGTLFGADVLAVWAGEEVVASQELLLALGAWLIVQAWVSGQCSLLYGLSRNRGAGGALLLEGIVTFGLAILLIGPFGVAGVGFAMVGAGLLTSSLIVPALVRSATAGRLQPRWGLFARSLGLWALFGAAGLLLLPALAGSLGRWARLLTAVPVVGALAFAGFWWLALEPDDRGWLRRAAEAVVVRARALRN